MGRHDDHPLAILALELAPAALFAASVGFAVSVWTNEPLVLNVPLLAAGAAFLAAWLGLRSLDISLPTVAAPFSETAAATKGSDSQVSAEIPADDNPGSEAPVNLSDEAAIASASDLLARIGGRHVGQDVPLPPPLRDPDGDIAQVLDDLRRALR